jgi:Tol biopolymer transport system component/TolB-like protein
MLAGLYQRAASVRLFVVLQQRLEARVVAEGPCHSGRCAGDGGRASSSAKRSSVWVSKASSSGGESVLERRWLLPDAEAEAYQPQLHEHSGTQLPAPRPGRQPLVGEAVEAGVSGPPSLQYPKLAECCRNGHLVTAMNGRNLWQGPHGARLWRVLLVYAGASWAILEATDFFIERFGLPDWFIPGAVLLLLIGLVVLVATALVQAQPRRGADLSEPEPWEFDLSDLRRSVSSGRLPRLTWARALLGGLLAFALLAAGAGLQMLLSGGGDTDVGAAESSAADDVAARTLAVLPFSVRGSEQLAYLGAGMVDLLTSEFADDAELEVVDPYALLSAVEGVPDPDRGRAIAQEFGARMYVLGSVFEVEGTLRITASLYDRSRGGRPLATRSVDGAVGDVLALVPRLSRDLSSAIPASPDADEVSVRLVWSGPGVDVLGSPSPDGRFLSFTDWSTGDLAIRDLAADSSRRITDKGSWSESEQFAEFSRIAPDGRRIAYAWWGKGYELRISDIDGSGVRTLLETDSIGGWVAPYGWRPDGGAILAQLVAVRGSGWDRGGEPLELLGWVDPQSGSVDTVKVLDVHWAGQVALSPDGAWIAHDRMQAVGSVERDVHVVAADGSVETTVVRHPANDLPLAWTPDGKVLLFWSDRGSAPGIWGIPVDRGEAVGEPVLVRSDVWWTFALGFVRDELYYGVRSSEQDVHQATVDIERAELREPPERIALGESGVRTWPASSPDGDRLAYLVSPSPGARSLNIAVRDLSTGAVREYSIALEGPRDLQWSPAGDGIVFLARNPFEEGGILAPFRLDLESGVVERVTLPYPADARVLMQLRHSADGRFQYARTWTGDRQRLVRWDLESDRQEILYEGTVRRFDLSNDGRWIAFVTAVEEQGRSEVRVLPASGGSSRVVHELPAGRYHGDVWWTPDGRHLLFMRINEELDVDPELWRVRLADGDARSILSREGLRHVDVHPDGRRIAFTAGTVDYEVWVMKMGRALDRWR